jgi:hypothetical protein
MSLARRSLGSAGIQTAALGFGGYTNTTEEYDGSSWTAGGNLSNTVKGLSGAGTQTAGLSIGGFGTSPTPSAYITVTESYNGSNWTTGSSLNTVRETFSGSWGTQTAAVVAGGVGPATSSATELWNGTSWTSNPTGLANARFDMAAGTSGTQTAGLGFGGYTPGIGFRGVTEEWTGPTLTVKTITTS